MRSSIPLSGVKYIQTELRKIGLYSGNIDGIRTVAGKTSKTDTGIDIALGRRQSELTLKSNEGSYKDWSEKRKAVAFFQLIMNDLKFEAGPADGFWGPQTDVAFDLFSNKLDRNWRDDQDNKPSKPVSRLNPNGWPKSDTASVRAFFGQACKPPLVKVDLPFKMKYAWDLSTETSTISVHEKVADSVSRVFNKVNGLYTPREIVTHGLNIFSGAYNCRNARGSNTTLSKHSWGIAIDTDNQRNQLKWGRDRAYLAKPELIPYWEAWEEEGWTSLGRTKNYDWMHVQATHD